MRTIIINEIRYDNILFSWGKVTNGDHFKMYFKNSKDKKTSKK